MNEQITRKFEDYIRSFVKDYLNSEKEKGKSIDDVNPWQELNEEKRLEISTNVFEKNNFLFTEAGGTVVYLIIESELYKIFTSEYIRYCDEHPVEEKVEEIFKKKIDSFVEQCVRDDHIKENNETVRMQLIHIFVHMLDHYMRYYYLKIIRGKDNLTRIVMREDLDEIEKIFNESMNKYIK